MTPAQSPPRRGKPGVPQQTALRREEIIKRVRRFGFSIHKGELAREFGVCLDTIKNDFKRIIAEWPEWEQHTAYVDLASGLEEALRIVKLRLQTIPDESIPKGEAHRISLQAASTLGKLANDYTKLQEAYGKKEKPSETLHIGAANEPITRTLIRELLAPRKASESPARSFSAPLKKNAGSIPDSGPTEPIIVDSRGERASQPG